MGNANNKSVSTLGIIEAAVCKGQTKDGVQNGPKEIRKGGLDEALKKAGGKITEYGAISQDEKSEEEPILNCKHQRALVQMTEDLAEAVRHSVSENRMTLILGGDHSLGIGAILGQCYPFPDSYVVWVDAHADINTPESSSSMNTHGMPVSFLLPQTHKLIPQSEGFERIKPVLEANRLIYIGLRDVDTPELKYLKDFNIMYFNMQDVRALGISTVMEIILKHIGPSTASIHLSFDIDALDPKHAPSTGTPVPGGLELDEGKFICKTLAETGNETLQTFAISLKCRLRSMAMAEVNTSLGSPEDAKTTVHSAVELIKSALFID